ncbi:hypothetical protein GQ53DRAFT_840858 [Thozetella sp. PMI_491]|nr:hypothetical protein GQ53DRAFT_840858 [Thozetella sp. PMI_491]
MSVMYSPRSMSIKTMDSQQGVVPVVIQEPLSARIVVWMLQIIGTAAAVVFGAWSILAWKDAEEAKSQAQAANALALVALCAQAENSENTLLLQVCAGINAAAQATLSALAVSMFGPLATAATSSPTLSASSTTRISTATQPPSLATFVSTTKITNTSSPILDTKTTSPDLETFTVESTAHSEPSRIDWTVTSLRSSTSSTSTSTSTGTPTPSSSGGNPVPTQSPIEKGSGLSDAQKLALGLSLGIGFPVVLISVLTWCVPKRLGTRQRGII